MRGRKKRYAAVFIALAVLTYALAAMNICIGSIQIPLLEIPRILSNPGLAESDTLAGIVWKIRLPRLLSAALLGGALALSGFLLQTFFANPIAGPYVLGISSGAKLAVAAAMVVWLGAGRAMSSQMMIAAAFIGAMAAMLFVMLIAAKLRRASLLVVSGVMVGYICSAITDFIVTFADDASIVNLHEWSRGSFSGASWEEVRVMAAAVTAAFVASFLLSKPISAYQLGESYAQNAGVNVKRLQLMLTVLSSFLSACVAAFAGPVSFVGIAAPHIAKAALGSSKPILVIPACFLGGAGFCLGCDLIARAAFAPADISISSVTALFGAPIVIAVMVRRRREG